MGEYKHEGLVNGYLRAIVKNSAIDLTLLRIISIDAHARSIAPFCQF